MSISTLVAAATLAIVTQDQSVLRAAPRESAQTQTVLSQGDTLEVRGEKQDFLQVYDHRRERAGYVRASQVRRTSLTSAEAPELLAVARFVRDTPGSEAMGIALVAAYIKAAPTQAIDAEPFDILGTLADRLARRASTASKAQERPLPRTLKSRKAMALPSRTSSVKVACEFATTAKRFVACSPCQRTASNLPMPPSRLHARNASILRCFRRSVSA